MSECYEAAMEDPWKAHSVALEMAAEAETEEDRNKFLEMARLLKIMINQYKLTPGRPMHSSFEVEQE